MTLSKEKRDGDSDDLYRWLKSCQLLSGVSQSQRSVRTVTGTSVWRDLYCKLSRSSYGEHLLHSSAIAVIQFEFYCVGKIYLKEAAHITSDLAFNLNSRKCS